MGIDEHFEGVKAHWAKNFAFLDYFKKVYGRDKPLPKWTDADVDEFIASDPVYGPQLKAMRESRKFALGGALVGGAHLGGIALKYSKAPHGVVLATGFGAICGAVVGSEVAEHWYELYKTDKQGANLRKPEKLNGVYFVQQIGKSDVLHPGIFSCSFLVFPNKTECASICYYCELYLFTA
uniref:Glycine zipper 2TM domain-containing protein n=1 Tax=Oryza punctata TaxID=4537 RepID=A0A0E0LQL3_ORYPU